ncbi:Beta-ketoacyl synthase [Macrophomina phaseolina MS6]|uniref:beta-ketoacyl-[acyl-carrier-protein] synthase I n=1 Tax=Macrophomina phaseolina (strain MS6) TaxID=1126212 RepID=K2S0T9_MACPH|nr:Beta-ketoacyl synthase [Macrophomina phaseolina MS6]
MMKRTCDRDYAAHDAALNIHRRILGSQADIEEIRYEGQGEREADPQPDGKEQAQPVPEKSVPTPAESAPNEELDRVADAAADEVPDAPVTAAAVVTSLVAVKLKKAYSEINTSHSIKRLGEGRSTIENELVGDLDVEFAGRLPEGAGQLPIRDICEKLQTGYRGTLGKPTSTLISKLISAKFPGDFGQPRVRELLRTAWGLGQGRQDAVLLLALTRQPQTRLGSEGEVVQFLDGIVRDYMQQEGLPPPRKRTRRQSRACGVVVDAGSLQILRKQQTEMAREMHQVLTRYIGPDIQPQEPAKGSGDADAAELALWRQEHGDEYVQGIRPMFDARKIRQYDSFWNWNAQDILRLALMVRDASKPDAALVEELRLAVMNRACERSVRQLEQLRRLLPQQSEVIDDLHKLCINKKNRKPVFIDQALDLAPITTVEPDGTIRFSEKPRPAVQKGGKQLTPPPVFPIDIVQDGAATYSKDLTRVFAEDMRTAGTSGVSFSGKNVLLTGAGKKSIGLELLKNLLMGGARVIVTTSSYSLQTTKMYQAIYARYGARDSVLRVIPFNQGSHQDVEALAEHIDDQWELDFIVPLAAVSTNGRELDQIDSKTELGHRVMLTGLLRLLGAIARRKRGRGVTTRPALVLLPLSPNHGTMGNDGLYAEAKLGLEAAFSKWSSESWRDYLCLCGVVIGWTRGTGLMNTNDILAQGVEALGARTFSTAQMAGYMAGLMGGKTVAVCREAPIVADLGGGLSEIKSLKTHILDLHRGLNMRAEILQAIKAEDELLAAVINRKRAQPMPAPVRPRAQLRLPLPTMPRDEDVAPLRKQLEGMVDLSRTVVVTGFSELGPYGSSRTRWEMEAHGELSTEGCIELAWMMGLIRHHNGLLKDGSTWSGWVDVQTMEPVEDADIKPRYADMICEQTGLRLVDPAMSDNEYDPERKVFMQEIALSRDMPPFETSLEVANELTRQHGDKAVVTQTGPDACTVQLKAGATVCVPRASNYRRGAVAGQIPKGWSAKKYGIADEIIELVDPVTLYSLVCTVEALLCSGITDPYELYSHLHVTDVAICIGSSMGGMVSLRKMHRDRHLDKPVQCDILQETFVNTVSAWVNMLLLSSSGPIKTPVGACASSLEALDTGYDLIITGKAKACIIGGFEDFAEDVSYEFGNMKATGDAEAEFAAGRTAADMTRPMSSTRSGFVESQGCGVQVITSAKLALEMGLPIFGIVAHSGMAADKIGRSVSAPGKGVLSNARESNVGHSIPYRLLDINYRRSTMALRRQQIKESLELNLISVEEEIERLRREQPEGFDEKQYRAENRAFFEAEAAKDEADAVFALGNRFWRDDPRISPIRGSLAVWGLGIDDLAVASLHGTSTVQNDLNETAVIQAQMDHLGRKPGNPLLCVCQKWMVGHSKGAAGAWAVNQCMQMFETGLLPGNRNLDNVDAGLRKHEHLLFPNCTLQCGDFKACSVTSFGFGQKGAQTILVHPRYLFATVTDAECKSYALRRDARWKAACKHFNDTIVNDNMCLPKVAPPYDARKEMEVLLDPNIRLVR